MSCGETSLATKSGVVTGGLGVQSQLKLSLSAVVSVGMTLTHFASTVTLVYERLLVVGDAVGVDWQPVPGEIRLLKSTTNV